MACAERYPDVEYQQLHLALAEHHQIPDSWILAGNGETEAIFTLVQGLKPRQAMIVTPALPNTAGRCSRWTARYENFCCVKRMAGSSPGRFLTL